MSKVASFIARREAARSPDRDQSCSDPFPGESNGLVVGTIAAQARLHPDQAALVMGPTCVTYRELEFETTKLARYLQSGGAGPAAVVAVCLERSPEFIIAALAILKCGAAYLPIDPKQPAERLRFMIEDAAACLVVTRAALAAPCSGTRARVISIDSVDLAVGQELRELTTVEVQDDSLAYVIYTSGSTGQPKGVEITQRNLSHLISWHAQTFGLDPSTRATFLANVGFDAAVWEIWPALATGATLYLPDDSTRLSPETLRDWLVLHRVTISFVPTAIAEQLINLRWPEETALRFLLTGADTLHRRPPPGLPFLFINNYGPTECTVVTTSGIIFPDGNQTEAPTIGRPIDRVQIHLLDEQLHHVPDGAIGEIHIGGAGVGRGYRNRTDLTAERFILDPFHSGGSRLYRTGDLARRLPNGEIAFLGRIDDQVKIRGYRIELGEISAVLNKHPSVKTSAVMAREDSTDEKRLVAYVVPATSLTPDEQSLREILRKTLPDYMEPAAFVWMDALPLTPNGKIDRSKLPQPDYGNRPDTGRFVAPRTPVEARLARIIADVLKLPRIGVEDDFFHLGAHSLLGAQIIARVRSEFGADLKLLDVFDAPTVAGLAVRIEQSLVQKLSRMSEAEVSAALAAFDQSAISGIHSP